MATTTERKPIKGDDIFLKLDGKPTLHATSHTINLSGNYEEYQTKTTKVKKKVLIDVTGTASVEGLVYVGASTDELSADALLDMFLAQDAFELIVSFGGKLYKALEPVIKDFQSTAPVAQNATYSASIEFSGLEATTATAA